MADHVRRQLREAVATAVTGLTTTGSSVFQSRIWPVQSSELPALLVYTTTETVTTETIENPEGQRREIEVRVDGIAKAAANLDDTLDQIAKEVETALAAAITVAGKSVRVYYTGCEIEFDAETEAEAGAVQMRFTAELFTAADAPDALIEA
ncbi:MAG: hypothetical protein MUF79_14660 [Burkholderiales bacterium]|jgi:hypothetical protein|nr:hypothetical protein [Burkholderiales bacterium]